MAGSVVEWNSRHPQIGRLNHGYTSKSARRNIRGLQRVPVRKPVKSGILQQNQRAKADNRKSQIVRIPHGRLSISLSEKFSGKSINRWTKFVAPDAFEDGSQG